MTHRDGFSVMEALAATVLLTLAMIPIYDMLTSLHGATSRLGRASQAPFVEATALTLLHGPDGREEPFTDRGVLSVDGWSVEWERRILSNVQPAGAPYGADMIDIWLEELELVLVLDTYRLASTHRRIGWSPRHDSLEAYLMTLE